MARAALPKPPKAITHNASAPAVVQAVQIALIAMKTAKVSTWEQFLARPDADLRKMITLTQEQQGLLEDHRHLLPYLKVTPLVSVAACNTCGRYALAGSAAVPQKCSYTLRCPGTVVKATATDFRTRAKKAADSTP